MQHVRVEGPQLTRIVARLEHVVKRRVVIGNHTAWAVLVQQALGCLLRVLLECFGGGGAIVG